MSERYVSHKFIDAAQVKEFTDLLMENDVPYIVEDSIGSFDIYYRNNEVDRDLIVKIKEKDSQIVRIIMEDVYQNLLKDVDPNHYLLGYSNDDLLEIVSKPDEWGLYDYYLACELLMERGVVKEKEVFTQLETKRVERLKVSYADPSTMLTLGYLVMFLVPFFGIIIGHQLYKSNRKLPDGTLSPLYSPEIQSQGKVIFYLSIILLITYLGYMWVSLYKRY